MTYIQIVNAVLRRLREAEVSTVGETEYATLIGDLINETKREVEDSWDWLQLRTTIQINTVANTFRYTLTGAGDRYKIIQAINDTEDLELRKVPYTYMNKMLTGNDVGTGIPVYWDINGNTGGDPNIDLYLIPDGIYDLNFNMIIPQLDLTAEGDTITVPSWPVILGAYSKAVAERGEEGSTSFMSAEKRYNNALGDAIAKEASHTPDETVSRVV